jgi:hypothetical protein
MDSLYAFEVFCNWGLNHETLKMKQQRTLNSTKVKKVALLCIYSSERNGELTNYLSVVISFVYAELLPF